MTGPIATSAGVPAQVAEDDAIDLRGLSRSFKDLVAVDKVDLAVARGELFGLLGPDGAGKSTLIRMLATVIEPTSGDAFVLGDSVVSNADAIKPSTGYMSQRFSLYPDLTVSENLDFFAELRGVPRAEKAKRAEDLLRFAGLTGFESRQAQFLSGGMKQKLALAATLIHEPDVIFLDEPTTGVDPVSRREFWRILAGLHRRGITIVVATPYMDEAELCTRAAFMDQGRILLTDTPAEIKRRVPGRLIEATVDDHHKAMPVARALPFVHSVDLYGESLQIIVGDEEGDAENDIRSALEAAGVTVGHVEPAPMSMEVAFARIMAEAGSSAAFEKEATGAAVADDGDAE
jgi:ABC-2 type transport system ATP-binding protein